MSKKQENVLLSISIIIAVAILGIGGLSLFQLLEEPKNLDNPQDRSSLLENTNGQEKDVGDRISFGDKIIVKTEEIRNKNQEFQDAKKRGILAMADGNYEKAARNFEEAISKYGNAPETLIYLNNARIGANKFYSIAVSAPIGTDPDTGLAMLRGVAQAQNEINQAGGINGVLLKVIIANDDDDPEIAKKISSEFVKEEILGVVGHYSSGVTIAAGDVYDSGKLVTISAASTSVKLSGFSPYVFRTVPSDAFAARALANYMMTELQQNKAAVLFNPESIYSQSIKSEFVTAVSLGGGQVVDEIEFSDKNFNAFKLVQRAIDRGAQVLMLAPTPVSLDKALQVVTVNRKRLYLLGGDVMYAPKTLQVGGEEAVNMVLAVFWHIDGDPNSNFPRSSRKLWSADVNWLTAMSYDAAQALIAAIERNPTRSGVQQALSAPDFSATGATGTILFQPSGDRNGSVQLVKIIAPSGGSRSGTGYDFVPVPR
ncbi:MAG: ABC transporter substrate-binding protein [Hormoscilla sp.]